MTEVSVHAPLDQPHAHPATGVEGVLRQTPADFYVEEILGFEPDGDGEHVFLLLQKRSLTTEQVAARIAAVAGVAPRAVSYAGLKDRHAVTRQWFSVHLPGKQVVSWEPLASDQLTVLASHRHRKKLRRGAHRCNRFAITLRELAGATDTLQGALATVAERGVPNYFGEQRFGRAGDNVARARDWFASQWKPSRARRGLLLSAVRAQLFNSVLARRVRECNWDQVLAGELVMLDGSHSLFLAAGGELDDLRRRLRAGDIHATGPLYGATRGLAPQDRALALEQDVLSGQPELCEGLLRHGLVADRRALRVIPRNLTWQLSDGDGGESLALGFDLPPGCFATVVVRELCRYRIAVPAAAADDRNRRTL